MTCSRARVHLVSVLAALLLQGICSGLCAEVRVSEDRQEYVLVSSKPHELRREFATALRARAAKHGSRTHALVDAGIETRYVPIETANGGCRLADVVVHLHLVWDVPRWQPHDAPSDAAAEQFERTLRELSEHGESHRRNAVEAAQRIDAALAGLPVAKGCADTRRDAAHATRRELVRLRAEDAWVDAATNERVRAADEFAAMRAKQPDQDGERRGRRGLERRANTTPQELGRSGW